MAFAEQWCVVENRAPREDNPCFTHTSPGALRNVLDHFGYDRHTTDSETNTAVFVACLWYACGIRPA